MLVLVDIDLTIADARERLEKAGLMPHRDEKAHFQRWLDTLQSDENLLQDKVIYPVKHVIEALNDFCTIVYLTGRSEMYREATQKWLDKNSMPFGPLHMRGKDDWRSARDYKQSVVEELKRLYEIDGGVAIDDDSEGDCGSMYQEQGFVHLKVFLPKE